METKYIIIASVFLLIAAGFVFLNNNTEDIKVYSGPVRPFDDEVYFRKTGITKPMEIKE